MSFCHTWWMFHSFLLEWRLDRNHQVYRALPCLCMVWSSVYDQWSCYLPLGLCSYIPWKRIWFSLFRERKKKQVSWHYMLTNTRKDLAKCVHVWVKGIFLSGQYLQINKLQRNLHGIRRSCQCWHFFLAGILLCKGIASACKEGEWWPGLWTLKGEALLHSWAAASAPRSSPYQNQ